jgi:hypothetical protein
VLATQNIGHDETLDNVHHGEQNEKVKQHNPKRLDFANKGSPKPNVRQSTLGRKSRDGHTADSKAIHISAGNTDNSHTAKHKEIHTRLARVDSNTTHHQAIHIRLPTRGGAATQRNATLSNAFRASEPEQHLRIKAGQPH